MWNILECVITEHRMFHARIWIWEKWEEKKKYTSQIQPKLSDRPDSTKVKRAFVS